MCAAVTTASLAAAYSGGCCCCCCSAVSSAGASSSDMLSLLSVEQSFTSRRTVKRASGLGLILIINRDGDCSNEICMCFINQICDTVVVRFFATLSATAWSACLLTAASKSVRQPKKVAEAKGANYMGISVLLLRGQSLLTSGCRIAAVSRFYEDRLRQTAVG